MIEPCPLSELEVLTRGEMTLFSEPYSQNALKAHLENPHGISLLWKENGETAGYVLGTLVAGEGELLRIAVFPKHRRKGIGTKLLFALEDAVRNGGGEVIFLEVRKTNLPARNLYENAGFSLLGVRPRYYQNPVEDGVLYEKKLKPRNSK